MELPRLLSSKVVRILVTILVLAILAVSVDVRETSAAFLSADVGWLLPAILTILVIRVIMAVRWWLILSAYGFSVDLWKVTKLIFVTSSLGSVLPIGLGQDLLRGYHVVRAEGRVSEVSASIIIDRTLGMISMSLVAVIAGIVGIEPLGSSPLLRFAVLSAVAILASFGVLYLFRRKIRQWCRFESTRLPKQVVAWINELSSAVFGGSINGRVLSSILLLSLLVQLARTAAFILVFTALGVSADALYYFVAIPIVFLLLQLPISVGGLGVREGALVVFFGDAGFPPEISVAGGLIFQCLQLVAVLPGLALFVFSKNRRRFRATE
jgi:uncharacterized protein (TIRG00374 family)